MKFYQIALFLFIFNMSIGVTNNLGLAPSTGEKIGKLDEGVQTEKNIQEQFNDTEDIGTQQGLLGDLNFLVENVRLVISGVRIFLDSFISAIFVKPILALVFCAGTKCGAGLNTLLNAVSILTMFVYLIGIVQLVTGRNVRTME